jgi:CxxC-x17-CxxC domain-containing protein
MIKNKRPNSFGAKKPFGERSGTNYGGATKSYGAGKSYGGGKSYGSDRYEGGGAGSDRPRTMHKATCSKCGVACEVPFKPRDANGVLCNGCFKRGAGPNKRPDFPSSERFERSERPERFERSERPERFERSERPERFERSERPERFERSERPERRVAPAEAGRVDAGAGNADLKRQLTEINAKLDAILLSLESIFEDEEE